MLGKGNKERVCPLGQKALEALLEYSRHYEEHWQRKPDGPAPVFLSDVGHANQPANDSTDYPEMVRACRREASQPARLPTFSGNPHAGRRRRSAGDSKATRPRVDHHDGNLHARGNQEGQDSSRQHTPKGVEVKRPGFRPASTTSLVAFWTIYFPPGSGSLFHTPCAVSIECRQLSRQPLFKGLIFYD